jgi:S-adenosylmethionine decarboxylase
VEIRPSSSEHGHDSHFTEQDGIRFSGVHLLIDMWGGIGLDDMGAVERALREAVQACGATLLKLELHRFDPNDGITGVATLSESHISIHSWPEEHYAAIDIFTCGSSNPYRAIPVLQQSFAPERLQVTEQKRGIKVV